MRTMPTDHPTERRAPAASETSDLPLVRRRLTDRALALTHAAEAGAEALRPGRGLSASVSELIITCAALRETLEALCCLSPSPEAAPAPPPSWCDPPEETLPDPEADLEADGVPTLRLPHVQADACASALSGPPQSP